jgi:hypothetical protein
VDVTFGCFLDFTDDIVAADGGAASVADYLLPYFHEERRRPQQPRDASHREPLRQYGTTAHVVAYLYFRNIAEWWAGLENDATYTRTLGKDLYDNVNLLCCRMEREAALLRAHFDEKGKGPGPAPDIRWSIPMDMTTFRAFLKDRGPDMDPDTIKKHFRAGTWRRKGPPDSRMFQVCLQDLGMAD